MQVRLDVIGVAVDIGQEKLGNGGFAAEEFFGESDDEWQAAFIFRFEGQPPFASGSRWFRPRRFCRGFFPDVREVLNCSSPRYL
jgi:hypothetical protein